MFCYNLYNQWIVHFYMARKPVGYFSFGFYRNKIERPVQILAQIHLGIQGCSMVVGCPWEFAHFRSKTLWNISYTVYISTSVAHIFPIISRSTHGKHKAYEFWLLGLLQPAWPAYIIHESYCCTQQTRTAISLCGGRNKFWRWRNIKAQESCVLSKEPD